MYNLDELLVLLKKQMDGSISETEAATLAELTARYPQIHQVLDKVQDDASLWEDLLRKLELQQKDEQAWEVSLIHRTHQKINATKHIVPISSRKSYRFLKIAATVLLVGMFSTLFITYSYLNRDSNIRIVHEINAPTSRAVLHLDDGSSIELDPAKVGLQVGENLTYVDGSALNSEANLKAVKMATLEVPKGSSYQLALSDGSKVWLNAGSTLTYPLLFSATERIVELKGEAYFEVAAKTHFASSGNTQIRTPFYIKTRKQTVEVIGTAFNIEAYAEDELEKTTLVHGKVKVHYTANTASSLFLEPGEQAQSSRVSIKKGAVQVHEVLSWKDNRFVFNNTDLSQALKILSRWYDFDIQYEGEIPQTQFYAAINRTNKLSTVLKILEKGGVKFRMEEENNRFRLIVRK